MWEVRSAYTIFVRKPEGKRPFGTFGRQRHGWVDYVKRYFMGIGWEWMHWIYLAQNIDS